MVHYEDDENSDLTLPAMRTFQPQQADRHRDGRARHGNGDVSIVDLYDNARILRPPGFGDPQMQADSSAFPRAGQRRCDRDGKAG